MISDCFKKIINNYLENSYLTILLDVKDPNLALLIIFKSVDMALTNQLCNSNANNFNERLKRYVKQMYKQTMSLYKERIESFDKDYSLNIPKILHLLNFDIYKLFNEFDNKLLIGTIILKKDLLEMSKLMKTDINIISERYTVLMNHLKKTFNENIRNVYLNEIELN
ncbi:MAG: hypothetical protein SOU19_09655 [Candidatus Caccosoma sp.]|nr:hypothetical protein [Candidatus Caccosoma sp.]